MAGWISERPARLRLVAGVLHRTVAIMLILVVSSGLADAANGLDRLAPSHGIASGDEGYDEGANRSGQPRGPRPTPWSSLGTFLAWVLIFCAVAFVLFLVVAGVLLWKAKQLVANAVRPDPEVLARRVAKLRLENPGLGEKALCTKVVHRQANLAGLVGFATGVGGLPTLAITLPIDIAATIRIQANMVHMIRLIHGLSEDEVPETGLWLATAGGMELATAGSTALREVVVKIISRSLLKFLPLLGGVIGFAFNWASTQTMGRIGLKWLSKAQTAKSS